MSGIFRVTLLKIMTLNLHFRFMTSILQYLTTPAVTRAVTVTGQGETLCTPPAMPLELGTGERIIPADLNI